MSVETMTRAEAVEWLDYLRHIYDLGDAEEAVEMAIGVLMDEPKHGKWLKIGDINSVQCSECLDDFDYIDGLCYLCHGQELPNYCPNCGAKMEGREE